MAAGAALRPSLAVEADAAWFAEPGIMNVMTNRRGVLGVRWEQFTPRGPEVAWAEVHAGGLYRRRGQLWALSAKGQLYGGGGHDGDLQVVPLPERGCHVQSVSAAPGTLWLLTTNGRLFVREGVEQSARGTAWVQLDLMQIDGCRLTQLSVGA
ncbi:tectonin beta-propeller repeat-containing protein 2-like [Pollicipes pollicipes]|uniref:tectonin beta-propeller repeat-containing protein 2-like n=1 Tax=Pollicipes pollicipes TaxID=41117 RepID=UPI00188589D8|nr:tectonin beta-propeller repeat-containing protein 2-like [Pollicipes pollicipes]